MAETIKERDTFDMYKSDMTLYSIVVNRRRAIPAILDGLKPVQRRIIYGAFSKNLTGGANNDKSLALVGFISGELHPHGDSSVYEALVDLAEWYKTKYILMQPIGGYGNVYNDVASASRYTHSSLSKFGYETMVQELKESPNIVNWIETYKRKKMMEPEYLPSKLPILLLNGSFGIAVGIQINVPSHNITEVVDVTRKLLKDPKAKFCLIPDLCQPCELIDTDWQAINDTGNGSFKVRGIITTEEDKKGVVSLHIRSLPQMTTCVAVYEKILAMTDKKELPMIKDIYNTLDDADGKSPDITIVLRPGVDPEYVKQIIYAKTPVQSTQSVNFEAISSNGIDIERYNYRKYLLEFINFRIRTKFRLYANKLQQTMTRFHYIDAFIKVLESGEIDNIIEMIKKQKTTDEIPIIEYIIKKCKTTDIQAKFIIDTNISKLTLAHLKKYKEEREQLQNDIITYRNKVTDDGTLIRNEIDQELKELGERYKSPRLCRVISAAEENNIPAGIFKIVVTENNYIRKIPDTDRINVIRKDNPKFVVRINNTDNLLLFDNKGKVYSYPVYKVPISDPKTGAGVDIRRLCKNLTSDIIGVFDENIFKEIAKSKNKHYLVVLTKNNYIKKMTLDDFTTITASGLKYTSLSTVEDEVVGLSIVPHNLDIVVGCAHRALRMSVKDISELKRNALGVIAMKTDDPIEGMSVLYPDVNNIIVITKNGKFNRFSSNLMTSHKRGSAGSGVIKLDSNDEIFTILGTNDNDLIRVLTADGVEVIPVANIKVKSSIAPGQKMMTSKEPIIKVDIVR